MDQFQLRALRRKRHVIAKNVTWDDAIIADLRSRNLLTKEMVEEIALVKDTSNFNKMVRYLDLLEENAKGLGANVFDRLVQFLGDHPVVGGICSIHDQLMTELAAERNELPIDGYLAVETSIMVEREFAGQGRTDAERRDIAAQITSRLQVYKEVWKRDIANAERRLADQLLENAEKESRRQGIIDRLRSLLQAYRSRIPAHLKPNVARLQQLAAPTEADAGDPRDASARSTISESIRLLIELCSLSLEERQVAIDDKRSGMNVLVTGIDQHTSEEGLGNSTSSSSRFPPVRIESAVMRDYQRGLYRSRTLVIEFDRRARPLNDELARLSVELERATRIANDLAVRLVDIDECRRADIERNDRRIDDLERELSDRTRRGRRLRREYHRLGIEIQLARAEIGRRRGVSQVLERTRTIGYAKPETMRSIKPARNRKMSWNSVRSANLTAMGRRDSTMWSPTHDEPSAPGGEVSKRFRLQRAVTFHSHVPPSTSQDSSKSHDKGRQLSVAIH